MLSAVAFEELIPWLTHAIDWFGKSGIDISPTRLGRYRRLLAEVLQLQQTLDWQRAAENFPGYINALFCAYDIAAIYAAFNDGAHNELIQPRLHHSVGGAVSLQDESVSASGNFARNMEFELVVAAHLLRGGARLIASDVSDVVVSLKGATAFIECKRLQSERGVESAVSKAKG